MLRKKRNLFFFLIVFILTTSYNRTSAPTTSTRDPHNTQEKYGKGYRYSQDGWIYVHIEGAPFERGKQYGYLLADQYQKALRCFKEMTFQTTGMHFSFFVSEAVRLHQHLIPKEYLDEMKGIAAGLTEANVPSTVEDIIGWNAWMEIVFGWWPLNQENYLKKTFPGKMRCSSFIATGSATNDGKIVLAHSTFDDFWSAQWSNIMLEIVPDQGHQLLMQATACYISSMTDFFVNGAGVFGSETTISGFSGYEEKGMPEYVRSRQAMQYATSIDEFVEIINKDNNGGVANTWLIGDRKTNEIGQFEQGLLYQNYQKKKDGYFAGSNTVSDPRIRNLECSFTGYNDIRQHTGARRAYLPIIIGESLGKLNVDISKKIIANHYSMYRKKMFPSAQSICAHFDEDPRYSMSSTTSPFPNPYTPAGAVDAKITTSDLAGKMQIVARWGRPCGTPFDPEKFFKDHPEWNWQEGYLLGFTRRDWSLFEGEQKGSHRIRSNY